MNRADWMLLVLDQAEGKHVEPVQLQKALFLLGKLRAEDLACESFYSFEPYDYGPFSRDIYADAESLESAGLATIQRPPEVRYKRYAISDQGRERSAQLRTRLTEDAADYLRRVVGFVQRTPFNDLVRSIYKAYPEMAANSVFRGR